MTSEFLELVIVAHAALDASLAFVQEFVALEPQRITLRPSSSRGVVAGVNVLSMHHQPEVAGSPL